MTSITPISGGYSRLTSVADIRTADGGEQKLILRSDPPSGHGVFDSDRDDEWQLLLALWDADAVDIPRPRFYDATGERLGSKTIVMDHVEGTPLQLTLAPTGDVRAARSTLLNVAAALQRIPLDALPRGHGRAGGLGHLHRQRDQHLRAGRARARRQQPDRPLCRRLASREPATACPARQSSTETSSPATSSSPRGIRPS